MFVPFSEVLQYTFGALAMLPGFIKRKASCWRIVSLVAGFL